MKLEQQVISLELAKRLKTLGVKQESYFSWYKNKFNNQEFLRDSFHITKHDEAEFFAAAFTVAELFELMPMTYASVEQHSNDYRAGWKKAGQFREEFGRGENPAEALGLMLAYLIQNNLMSV